MATTPPSPTHRFLDEVADDILTIAGVINRATADTEWVCAKADRFRDAMRGRVLQLTAVSLSLRELGNRVDGRHSSV